MLKVANDNTPATERPRSLVPIIMPDIPTKYHGYNKVDTATDQYVMFDSSSAYKDVSQTTVPFIDAQPVAPQPASWLGGAGLYHKVRDQEKDPLGALTVIIQLQTSRRFVSSSIAAPCSI